MIINPQPWYGQSDPQPFDVPDDATINWATGQGCNPLLDSGVDGHTGYFEANFLLLFSVMKFKTTKRVWHQGKSIEESKFHQRSLLSRSLGKHSWEEVGKLNGIHWVLLRGRGSYWLLPFSYLVRASLFSVLSWSCLSSVSRNIYPWSQRGMLRKERESGWMAKPRMRPKSI